MGTKYIFKCFKCKYQIDISLGVCFSFPMLYKEIVEKAKHGDFGGRIKEFLNTFPEGKIDAETVLYICQGCR